EHQPSFWVSDHDEALATHERREQVARLSSYLTFGFVRWRTPADSFFCTTEDPRAPPWAEDLASVADFFAGALCHLGSVLPSHEGTPTWVRVVSPDDTVDSRARFIFDWVAATHSDLRHVLLRL